MLLVLCAIGAALIVAGSGLAFGTPAALIVAGVAVVLLAAAWDYLYVEDVEPEADE